MSYRQADYAGITIGCVIVGGLFGWPIAAIVWGLLVGIVHLCYEKGALEDNRG